MKAFVATLLCLASVSAVNVGDYVAEPVAFSDVKTVYPVIPTSTYPGSTISWMSQSTTTYSAAAAKNMTTNMLVVGFSVGQ